MKQVAKTDSVDLKQIPSPDFRTCKEIAELMRISEISVRRMLTKKQLTRYKFGSRTLVRLSEALGLVESR
jgi:excisionase family DNA binding protein